MSMNLFHGEFISALICIEHPVTASTDGKRRAPIFGLTKLLKQLFIACGRPLLNDIKVSTWS
jgi:hypothetical protein